MPGDALGRPQADADGDAMSFAEDVRQALYASKICSYAQGFQLLSMASAEYGWRLDLRFHRPHVAWRVHHPRRVSRSHQGRLRRRRRNSRTCCSRRTSATRLPARRPHGGGWSPPPCCMEFRSPRSPVRWPGTTGTAASACPRTCSRPSATTSVPTPTSASIARAGNSSIPTGQVVEVRRFRVRTTRSGALPLTDEACADPGGFSGRGRYQVATSSPRGILFSLS